MSAHCLDCGEKTQRQTDGTLVIRHTVGCPNRRAADEAPTVEEWIRADLNRRYDEAMDEEFRRCFIDPLRAALAGVPVDSTEEAQK